MLTMNHLDAASLRKTWDREVHDFRATCQVRKPSCRLSDAKVAVRQHVNSRGALAEPFKCRPSVL
jgi:hypothetical protein